MGSPFGYCNCSTAEQHAQEPQEITFIPAGCTNPVTIKVPDGIELQDVFDDGDKILEIRHHNVVTWHNER